MNRIGLDMGSSKVKAVEITEQVGLPKLVSYDISNIPPVSLYSESPADMAELSHFLKDYLFSPKFTTTNVVVSIPESRVFTKIVEIPDLSGKELSESIKWEAQQYFPDSIDDLSIHYQTLPRSEADKDTIKNKKEVLLVAVSKSMIAKYADLLEQIGVNICGMEPESMSVCRAVQNVGNVPVSLAINIGSDSSDIVIIENDVIRFTRTVSTGTSALFRAISQGIDLDEKKAESYLASYGLDPSKLEGKIAKAVSPVFDIVLSEVKRSIAFFESRKGGEKVGRIVLCGGGAIIPGSLSYITEQIGIEAEMANPWRHLDMGNFLPKKDDLDILGPLFVTAVGLALKSA
ncbi:hypothetical protein COT49_02155 [candidate division WWE3 bacterium CG08_land_8_20_14_0_20_40_13]|uniref:SHS2 domain-containing protein n=1 Tax=candidate division WWE3 bacterium CG08_land_8_20_14_0_20_40_13 TaxID=1975084 RepID=A0A2H0XDU4_UNCKA|nr:MAG: hypothetical protein COT49_02155 [candidate division WWE3 bacterium CG08_land_8_20_14_0_20_40_13]